MRKWFWSCSAVAAAAVGSIYYAGHYACGHPDSWVADCVVASTGDDRRVINVHWGDPIEADVAEAVVPAELFPALESLPPARMPGQIVIDVADGDEGDWPAVMPRVRDFVGAAPPPGAFEESEAALAPMPRVGEEREELPPPHAEDEPADANADYHRDHPSCPFFGRQPREVPLGLRPRRALTDTTDYRPGDAPPNRVVPGGPF